MPKEYEVECVRKARIEKHRKKLRIVFLVHWKGYSPDDDTWEPLTSFRGGSAHFVDEFWNSADTGGRSYRDVSQFIEDEEINMRTGPPRVRTRPKRTATTTSKASQAESPNGKRKVQDEEQPTTSLPRKTKRRKQQEAEEVPDSEPERLQRRQSSRKKAVTSPATEPDERDSFFDEPDEGLSEARGRTQIIEGTETDNLDNAISVKSRIGRKAPGVSGSKTPKDKASLLTFGKTGPKVLKGRYHKSLVKASVPPAENGTPSSQTAIPEDNSDTMDLDGEYEVDDEVHPTDLGDLPDFEEETEEPAPEPAREGSIFTKGFTAIKNSIFNSPLWTGGSTAPAATVGTAESGTTLAFPLSLNSASSVTLLLHSANPDHLSSFRVTKGASPGKVYSGQHVDSVLNSVRCEGIVARGSVSANATPNESALYQKLVSELEAGKLFICVMDGFKVFALCATECPHIVQRFNVPQELATLPGELLVCSISIERSSQYAEASEYAANLSQ